jgi:N-acetylmuramidase
MKISAARSFITRDGLLTSAGLLGIEVPRLRAVLKVEAAGSGYDKAGRVLILFENHVFWRCLPVELRGQAQAAGLAYPKWGTRKYPADSYPSLLKAIELHPEAAFKACSYGLPQILGENHKQAGYKTAQEMFEAFRDKGESEHVAAMARFIRANPKMHDALKRGDMAGFASRYNGPGYRKNEYDVRLIRAEAFYAKDKWRGMAIDAPTPSSTPSGKSQADQGRDATKNAAAATAAAPTATVGTVAATPNTTAPWYVTYAPAIGMGLFIAVIAAVLIRRAIKSQPVEHAPMIEAEAPVIATGA